MSLLCSYWLAPWPAPLWFWGLHKHTNGRIALLILVLYHKYKLLRYIHICSSQNLIHDVQLNNENNTLSNKGSWTDVAVCEYMQNIGLLTFYICSTCVLNIWLWNGTCNINIYIYVKYNDNKALYSIITVSQKAYVPLKACPTCKSKFLISDLHQTSMVEVKM